MTKLEKEIRVLSLEELEKRARELELAELDAKKALFERVRESIIERDISDSRTWKDMGLFAGGLFTFQLGQIFLMQPLEPKWLNFVCAGLSFATSAYAVIATRLGYNKQKELMYDERKEYYTKNPEKVVEYYKECPRFDEHLKLEEIDKEKRLVDYYIFANKSSNNYRRA
jgi:hypothetical protein